MVYKNFDITWIPLIKINRAIGISHCPGKSTKDRGCLDQLNNDLKSLKHQKVDVIISLTHKVEIERLGISNFEKSIKNFGFIHFVEPIEDFSVPKSHRTKKLTNLIQKIFTFLEDGKSVLIHCNAGLGRSGLIAALLIKFKCGFEDPVSHVRNFCSGAIETDEQLSFVVDFDFTD